MSSPDPKRQRTNAPPEKDVVFMRRLGHGVYQATTGEWKRLTVGDGDLYMSICKPGPAIVDNTADIGLVRDGMLLQADSKVYLGFTSPSRYSVLHLSSSLQMFHDAACVQFRPFFQELAMVRSAKNPTSSSHLCIRFDFSPSTDHYFHGVSETLDAVSAWIDRVICEAIDDFVELYDEILPSQRPTFDSSSPFSTLLHWLKDKASETKLFIAVHDAHQVLERPLNAAYWAPHTTPPALDQRLVVLQQRLLEPIWSDLSSEQGVVRKFLVAGSHFVRGIHYPPQPNAFPGLPDFTDLTDCDSPHGFTSPQIRTVYALRPSTMPMEIMQEALAHCHRAVCPCDPSSLAREFAGIYTAESLESVFRVVCAQPEALDQKMDSEMPVYKAYMDATYEATARALYPLLLRNAGFRRKVEQMVDLENQLFWQPTKLGPVFSIAELIDASPSDEELLARVFMLGLMSRVKVRQGRETHVRYYLGGGCVLVLLQKLLLDTDPVNYTANYCRRDPSPAYVDHGPNAKLDFNVNTFDMLALTELSIATLIFDHYRPLKNYKQLPSLEETFQATMAKLHRAALLATFGDSAFVNAVQIEVAYRRRGNLFGDLIVKMTLPDGTEVFILHEYKSFDPGKTMNGTHAQLKAPRRLESQDLRDARTMLVGETKKTLIPIDMQRAWYNAMQQFLKEIASMRNLPPHWFFDDHPKRETVDLPFPLSIDDICAFFFKEQDDMKGSGIGKDDVKRAVEEAAQAVKQVGGYGDVSILGVADHLAVIGEPNTMGWADKRITSLGPGRTVIIPFAVVSVAGALAFVKKLEPVSIDQKLGIVDRYPWHKDQSHAEVEVELKLKREYSWNMKNKRF